MLTYNTNSNTGPVCEGRAVGLIQSLKTEYAIKYDKVLSDYFNISEK